MNKVYIFFLVMFTGLSGLTTLEAWRPGFVSQPVSASLLWILFLGFTSATIWRSHSEL